MNGIIISGLGANKAGDGLISLGDQIGLPYDYWEWNAKNIFVPDGDLFLIGHSIGVDTCLQIIASLNPKRNRCRYFASLDGVDGGVSKTTWNWKNNFYLPSNIEKADAFTRDWHFWNFMPPSSNFLITNENWVNHPPLLWTKHEDVPKHTLVISGVLSSIKNIPE